MRAAGDLRPVLGTEIGTRMPVHSRIDQAFLADLQRLPRCCGFAKLRRYDGNGVEIPDSETTECGVPYVMVVVPDTKMIPHLMY
jgi:hypothetical protein